jgi:FKBP-type peptidyl-prolyl cis-trans isomerase
MEKTELNIELNEINDGDELGKKIVELGYKGIKIQDLDENLLEFILDGFITGDLDYKKNKEEINKLKQILQSLNINHEEKNKKIDKFKKKEEIFLKENSQSRIRIEELEYNLSTLQRIINRFV